MNQNLLHTKTFTLINNMEAGTMKYSGDFINVAMYDALMSYDKGEYKIDPSKHRKNMIVNNGDNTISFYVV